MDATHPAGGKNASQHSTGILHVCQVNGRANEAVAKSDDGVRVLIRIVSCVITEHVGKFVLAVDTIGPQHKYPTLGPPWSHHWQLKLPHHLQLVALLNSRSCKLTYLDYAVRARCLGLLPKPFRPEDHPFATLDVALTHESTPAKERKAHGKLAFAPIKFPLGPMRFPSTAKLYHCASVAAYGAITDRLARLARVRKAWFRLGGVSTLAFSRSKSDCALLESVHNVSCLTIAPWNTAKGGARPLLRGGRDWSSNLTTPLVTPWFDQPMLQLTCLTLVQEATRRRKQPFIAFADLDELPPPPRSRTLLWSALDRVRAGTTMGLRLFFDAEHTCPQREGWCPASRQDWLKGCPNPNVSDPVLRRKHWKPIVLPERTYDLSPHTGVPAKDAAPLAEADDLWSTDPDRPLCLKHEERTNATVADEPTPKAARAQAKRRTRRGKEGGAKRAG